MKLTANDRKTAQDQAATAGHKMTAKEIGRHARAILDNLEAVDFAAADRDAEYYYAAREYFGN